MCVCVCVCVCVCARAHMSVYVYYVFNSPFIMKISSQNYCVFHSILVNSVLIYNRLIQAKSVASVTNCGLGLETAMASTVNRGWQVFTNDKYRKSFSKLFHITHRLRLVFQLNDCVFPKDLTQYLSRHNTMIERTDLSDE